ncbi:T9SS type A sorting domain-containing protein [Chloroflexi bacterium CFX2]|nr:T9SS type A sorting domain-containing protein [Chloroflexi bacterium CFX2]
MRMIRILSTFCMFLATAGYAQDDWTLQNPPVSPSARVSHGMASIGDDKVLLFGGAADLYYTTLSNETWVYDLSENTWTNMLPQGGAPTARAEHKMAFIGDDKVLLFGGGVDIENLTISDETWIYDLSDNTWTNMSPPGGIPTARWGQGMAFVGGDQVVLFGGFDDSSIFDDTWVYDLSANSWTLKNPTTDPLEPLWQGGGVSLAYVGGDQVLLLSCSFDLPTSNATWLYDLSDNQWQLKNEVSPAFLFYGAGMASLTGSDWVFLFGGEGSSNGTRVYDLSDNAWSLQSPANTPDHRSSHAMASIGTGKVLMFGGFTSNLFGVTLFNDTWVYAATLPAVTHTIIATAGSGGTITPSGTVVVNQGDNQSFTITPDANYQIADVLVDGSSVGSIASHTFNNVTADHTIAASFSTIANTTPAFISPTPECGSTINVDAGSPVSFTISAEDGDAGAVVTLSVSGMPSGSSMDPSLPTQGNPVSSMFTWTPTASDLGSHQVTYTATDNLGAAVSCTLTVQVADVPPPPSAVCPHSQGYWKNHSSKWPGSALSLMLGTVNNYNQSQLLSILNAAPRGDASIILAHQLIAAKLNVANGSPVPADVQSAITNADAAISTATIPMGIKANTTLGGYMTSLASLLDQYNNNLLTLNCVAMDKTKGDQREIVTEFALFQNFPNPFNPSTQLSWQSPVAGHQTLKVYDVLGNEVATLVDEYKDAGRYETTFDASRLASGIYFYRLRAGTFVETRKMLLVR